MCTAAASMLFCLHSSSFSHQRKSAEGREGALVKWPLSLSLSHQPGFAPRGFAGRERRSLASSKPEEEESKYYACVYVLGKLLGEEKGEKSMQQERERKGSFLVCLIVSSQAVRPEVPS